MASLETTFLEMTFLETTSLEATSLERVLLGPGHRSLLHLPTVLWLSALRLVSGQAPQWAAR